MKGWVVFILGKVSKAWSKRALLTGGTGGYLGNMGVGEAVGYLPPSSTSSSRVLCEKVRWATGNPHTPNTEIFFWHVRRA